MQLTPSLLPFFPFFFLIVLSLSPSLSLSSLLLSLHHNPKGRHHQLHHGRGRGRDRRETGTGRRRLGKTRPREICGKRPGTGVVREREEPTYLPGQDHRDGREREPETLPGALQWLEQQVRKKALCASIYIRIN